MHTLAGRSITLTYEPETIEDQEIMNAYGGLDNTPSYLIRLRPVITVDGAREIVGQGGLAAGSDLSLTVELNSPMAAEKVENTVIAGYPTIIGLGAQQVVPPEAVSPEAKNGERLLYERALAYIEQVNSTEDELASLLQLRLVRPLPTLVTLGGVLDVVSLLGAPHGFDWKGLYLDADLRIAETTGGFSPVGTDPSSLFMQMASLQGSYLEHAIFEDGFGVESVSTAKMLALAGDSGIADVMLDASNIDTVLPPMNLPDSISEDISNSVNRGNTVIIPESELIHEDWNGFAWLKENPETSESGWMLSGTIAGGMTALNPDLWPVDYLDLLKNPGIEVSEDPTSAIAIKVIRGPDDFLSGVAGQQLKAPLQVVAFDRDGKRVKGVEVVFSVKAGGGKLQAHNGAGSWQTEVLAATGTNGIAEVDFLFNQSTDINPTTAIWESDNTVQKVDETIVEVTTTSGLQTDAPIIVYGFPDVPDHLLVTRHLGTPSILTWSATLTAFVADQFDNPISEQNVDFTMGQAQVKSLCASSNNDQRQGLLVRADAPCMNTIPVYGECGENMISTITGTSVGAVAHVILGALPDADYPVTVTSGALDPQVITLSSSPLGVCDPDDPPNNALVLKVIYAADAFGNSINGGAVSTDGDITTIPLTARMYFVREGEDTKNWTFQCHPGTDTCPISVGTGEYYTDTDFVAASVKFDGTEAVPLGNGLFRVDYPLPKEAGMHNVSVVGEAINRIQVTADICDQSKKCQLVDFEQPNSVTHGITVYAVDVKVPQEKHFIPVNEDGYVTNDYSIEYAIGPSDYNAATSYFVLSKEIAPDTFQEIAYFDLSATGADQMTFLRGFLFDTGTAYKGQIVLNYGSDFMEVRSWEIDIIPLAIELDADLNHDGIFSEDDPAEYIAPGLVVLLNADDDDQDGVADNEDYDMLMIDNQNNATQVTDNELEQIELKALPATITEGSVKLEIIQGADKVRIWTTQEKGTDNILLDVATTGSTQKTWTLGAGNDLSDLSQLSRSMYVEGVVESNVFDDTAILLTKYISPGGVEIELDRLVISVQRIEMIPDYNRDGKIDDEDRGKVSETKPWRYWVNNDSDANADAKSGIGKSKDDLPGTEDEPGKDNLDEKVNGFRDLVDFFPLYMDLHKLVTEYFPIDSGYTYSLVHADSAVGFVEGGIHDNVLSAAHSYNYLEELDISEVYSRSDVKVATPEGVELSQDFLEKMKESQENGIILVEGIKATTKPLRLEIRKGGNVYFSYAFPLVLTSVEDMFSHKDLRTSLDQELSSPRYGNRHLDADPPNLPEFVKYNPNGSQNQKKLVMIHGFNVTDEAGAGIYAEVFKRLFHAGLNARFYGVGWYGDQPGAPLYHPPSSHYHEAIVGAFATSNSNSRRVLKQRNSVVC